METYPCEANITAMITAMIVRTVITPTTTYMVMEPLSSPSLSFA